MAGSNGAQDNPTVCHKKIYTLLDDSVHTRMHTGSSVSTEKVSFKKQSTEKVIVSVLAFVGWAINTTLSTSEFQVAGLQGRHRHLEKSSKPQSC
jgi:hypothetical protein